MFKKYTVKFPEGGKMGITKTVIRKLILIDSMDINRCEELTQRVFQSQNDQIVAGFGCLTGDRPKILEIVIVKLMVAH